VVRQRVGLHTGEVAAGETEEDEMKGNRLYVSAIGAIVAGLLAVVIAAPASAARDSLKGGGGRDKLIGGPGKDRETR
jgi:Ca2+-binding RTX toxin-like protein